MLVRYLASLPLAAVAHKHAMIGESGKWYGEWEERQLPSYMHKNGYEVLTTEYVSPSMKLKTGEAHFTINPFFHVPFPNGTHVVLRADFHVVDGTGNDKIPLSELYNHHWLIGTQDNADPLFACENNLFFGAGAEMRNTPTIFPEGWGMKRYNAKGYCGANLHFIRTQDLATQWEGFNDPSQYESPEGAAKKNCVECQYAPGRAPECVPELDGNFACCFTGSRCPVNDPKNHSTKEYRLKYQVQWTKDMITPKAMTGTVLDVSGGLIEWNIAPNLNIPEANQRCDSKMCNITRSWTVDSMGDFGSDGICSGTMMWSYMHQHNGAINGSMFVNGKHYCSSFPTIGTDPDNTPGNEKGYVTGFTKCIDQDNLGNQVRLNEGDVVTLEALYDVDESSERNFPFPGGKHGGIMGLYFMAMDCDDGKWPYQYHCAEDQCIKVRGAEFETLEDCQTSCGSGVGASVDTAIDSSAGVDSGVFEQMKITKWEDCGDYAGGALAKVTSLDKDAIRLGINTPITGSGYVEQAITGGTFNILMQLPNIPILPLALEYTGDLCERKEFHILLGKGIGKLVWDGIDCPMNPGNFSNTLEVSLAAYLPPELVESNIVINAADQDGNQVICLNIDLARAKSDASEVAVI